jgi:hypothetical protein
MKIGQSFFSGERPRVASHISKDYEAQIAQNCDLSRGDLRALKAHARSVNLAEEDAIKTLFQWKKSGTDEWITHTAELDFVQSPVAGEAHDRVYFTGGAEPRVLTSTIVGTPFDIDTDFYKLGVPAPAAAPTIDAGYTPGSDYRAYFYSYVVKLGTSYREEGVNSPLAEISDYGSGDVTLSGFTAPPAGRSIGAIRVYRTAASSSGVAEFLYVGQFDTAAFNFTTGTFTDDKADAELGEAFTCENWVVPPSGLSGIISIDGGSLAGFYGNRVYVTPPYLPHAWPYSYPVDGTIIGLGAIANTVVVLTDAFIYFMSGTPEAMSTTRLNGRYPCSSKGSIRSTESGVFYASPEGIVVVTLDGPAVYTYDLFTKTQNLDNYSPTTMMAEYYQGHYVAFYDDGCLAINTREKTMIRIGALSGAAAVPHVSLVDNRLYFVWMDGEGVNAIYEFAQHSGEDYGTYLYRSKDWILPYAINFSAVMITRDLSDYGEENAAAFEEAQGSVNEFGVNESAINGDQTVKTYRGLTFRLYGDGRLVLEVEITSDEPIRLPARRLYRRCYYDLEGDVPVAQIRLATSMEELIDAA